MPATCTDAADNLTADGTATYTYDALSRMTARGSTTYSYNGDGVLVNLYYRAAPYAIMPMTTASFARYSASYIS